MTTLMVLLAKLASAQRLGQIIEVLKVLHALKVAQEGKK
jgi:hypothetical protein